MKKIFNSRFLIIVSVSVISLIILVVGAFYLFDDKDSQFIKSGYVLNSNSESSEKYFFNEDTGYRENLSNKIEFIDVDNNKVFVNSDSFIHYLDNSISFLRDGAILDMDSVKDTHAVKFYNVNNDIIIKKNDDKYIINSTNDDINFSSFIGRISDNKYIVVGDLTLKMSGNDSNVKGDYFEIVYSEEGIVNIENKNVKYQVAAEGTAIHLSNGKVIDLGTKAISIDGKNVMSLTAITINGDENIEIVPKDIEEETTTTTSQSNNGNETPSENNGNASDGEGEKNDDGAIKEEETKEKLIVKLKDSSVGSTNINVSFDILNKKENDVLKLQVVSLASGKTVDISPSVINGEMIRVNLLSPDTKYLVMVVNEKDNSKEFQKIFETSSFGIKLEKGYVSSDKILYTIKKDDNTDIRNAKLSLYKFNEETMKNEVVVDSYIDSETGNTVTSEKVVYLVNLTGTGNNYEVIFDNLDSDTIYTAVLDEFSLDSTNFKDIYNITLSSMTLKKTPDFGSMSVNKIIDKSGFELSIGQINDPDGAIKSYTYMIYDADTNKLALEPIKKNNTDKIFVGVGGEEDKLKDDTNYYYKVIVEYFDNEKYIEYVSPLDSIIFNMPNNPYVTVSPIKNEITYDSIKALITLIDKSCLISMPGRKCDGPSSVVVEVRELNSSLGSDDTNNIVFRKNVDFNVENDRITYNLSVDGLKSGITYGISVKAKFNNENTNEYKEILHTDDSEKLITTKKLSSFDVEWEDKNSTEEYVINTTSKLVGNSVDGSMSADDSSKAIKKIILNLYEGNDISDLDRKIPIATTSYENSTTFNIKEKFYDNAFNISSTDTFNLSIDDLKNLNSKGELTAKYTIKMDAYYDFDNINKVNLNNNILVYQINPQLLVGDIDAILDYEKIIKSQANDLFPNLKNQGTIIGYKINGSFDREGFIKSGLTPNKVNVYVYDAYNKNFKYDFYIKDANGNLVLTKNKAYSFDLENKGYFSDLEIYMDYGSSYETVDEVMKRGNTYVIGYEIESTDSKGTTWLNTTPSSVKEDDKYATSPTGYGVYMKTDGANLASKETPTVKMYPIKSTANKITYKYSVDDPDNAFYKENDENNYGFYVKINNSENEIKYNITKVEDSEFNKFSGEFTITGLNNGDGYNLYYKKNSNKTGNINNDVLDYYDDNNKTKYFDGFYDLDNESDEYNFKYQIISNQDKDNRVVIKLLMDDSLFKRMLSYTVKFNDTKGQERIFQLGDNEMAELTTCPMDSNSDMPRCLSIDYSTIKEMKSTDGIENIITVSVSAYYDNGLTGFGYSVGNKETDEYKYTILQGNNYISENGKYIGFSSNGKDFSILEDDTYSLKGFYQYTLQTNGNLFYQNMRYPNSCANKPSSFCKSMSTSLTSNGYVGPTNIGYINPKMVSLSSIKCEGTNCNKFSFSSITPKVKTDLNTSIINGAYIDFALSGVDINDILQEGNKRYLYVDVWDNLENVGNSSLIARPTVKVEINSDSPTEKITGLIDSLAELGKNTGNYYYTVSAKMRKNNSRFEMTQLYDAKITDEFKTTTYQFNALNTGEIFHSVDVKVSNDNTIYNNKNLITKINLLPYKNNKSFNFDLLYSLCEVDNLENCSTLKAGSSIFTGSVNMSDIKNTMEFTDDISSYDLEYGKEYHMWLYAKVNYYNTNNKNYEDRYVILNRFNLEVNLNKLAEPSFLVTKSASVNNGNYAIDFSVNAIDKNHTLVNGNYKIKLLDDSKNIVGNMEILDENSSYIPVSDYENYSFSALDINKKIRISGLEPDTKYTIVVYGDAYVNNASDTVPKDERRYVVSKSSTVYSTNDYGVAFGTASYEITDNSVVVTFLGGSSFGNVTKVYYTIGLWDADNTETISGEYNISENEKNFEVDTISDDWRFVINPEGMRNKPGSYHINISFEITDKLTGNKKVITSNDVPSFDTNAGYGTDI